LGRVQLEVVSALLSEKYKLETVVKEPSVIYMERPLKAASLVDLVDKDNGGNVHFPQGMEQNTGLGLHAIFSGDHQDGPI
jgi:translation elongation factor EF-G